MRYELKKLGPLTATVLLFAAAYSSGQSIKAGTKYCIDKIGQKEYALLLKAVPDDAKKRLADDADLRKKQVESLRQLFAFECEAEKRGLAGDETNASELDNIRSETTAVNYDKAVSKTPAAAPFSGITDAQIAEFYKNPANTAAFEKFLKTKLELLRRAEPDMPAVTEDQKAEAKTFFAKIRISENESVKNAATLGPDFKESTALQVSLQQAQFLARALSDKIAPEMSVNDQEVTDYIKGHPEFDTSVKKADAAKILARAKAGEDFAALADQYSEDPGNTGSGGKKNGGLYADVPKGTMVAPFETAALSLQPGTVYPDLVESDFGYHIIKLEKKTGTGDALKYDVRHILFSTTIKDPSNPNGRELPIKEYVRARVGNDKESAAVAKIVADNPIAMEDFVVPTSAAAKTVAAKPAATKPAAKKTAVRKTPVRRRH